MKECPRCKLINSDKALMCDCGYDFQSDQVKESDNNSTKNDETDFIQHIFRFCSVLVIKFLTFSCNS